MYSSTFQRKNNVLNFHHIDILKSITEIQLGLSIGHVLASPPGHSPKAERWPGTDCLRMLQNYTKTGVISKTPCTFREFVRARLEIRPFQFTSTMTSAQLALLLLLPIPSMTL